MTPKQEAAIWRRLGRRFEQIATGRWVPPRYQWGICKALRAVGLPAYYADAARVTGDDSHGLYGTAMNRLFHKQEMKKAASHRALTCYLMAEMVEDGCAPGGEVI